MALNPLWPEVGPEESCRDCAWHFLGGRGRAVPRCRRHGGARASGDWPACPAFAGALDCHACGACCREAFHVVEVSRRDPFARSHRALLEVEDGRLVLDRPGGRCRCLAGGPGAWRCTAYEARPRSCRDFAPGGEACLEARRRVGLTP